MLDEDAQTPLHVAIANGHLAAVERLTRVQPCTELHEYDKYKMLPLHLACENGDPEIIKLLLARGARVANSPASPTRAPAPSADGAAKMEVDSEGRSPVPKRKQLLAMQRSEIGGSAVFIAKQHGHHAVVALLERSVSESLAECSAEERSWEASLGEASMELEASSPARPLESGRALVEQS